MNPLKTNKNGSFTYIIGTLLIFLFSISVSQAEEWLYKVRKNDNLWNLTVDYLIDVSYVEKVQKKNGITDPWHILPGTTLRIPSQWVRHYPSLVRIQGLQGTAQIIDDGNQHLHPIKNGDLAMLGDTIITAANSSLLLGFLDGSRILLQENSRLKITHLMLLENTGMSDIQLKLLSGRLESQAAPNIGNARRFQINTPLTVTSVRGTNYRISAEKEVNESRTEVVEGKVLVKGDNRKRLLSAGFGIITKKNQAPQQPIKLPQAPDLKNIPTTFSQVPIQFNMPALDNELGYRVQIAKNKNFNTVLFDKIFNTPLIKGPDLADGIYHLRIRSINSQRLEGYNALGYITINARPFSPFLVLPKPGEGFLLEQTEIKFSWSSQTGVDLYHFQISDKKDFSNLLVDTSNIVDNQISLATDLPVGKYYWRIAGEDQQGDGPFSDGQLFRRIVPAPGFEEPAITEDTLNIRSRQGLAGQTYHFQMSEDENFTELLVDKYTDIPGFEIPRPNGGEYFIRSQTIDPDGFVGPFSAPQSINVPRDYYWLLTLLPLLALLAL
ncbi:MAG: FecR domain-containing protein [Methylococcales bacterium]